MSGDANKCICAQQSSVGNLTYDDIATSFRKNAFKRRFYNPRSVRWTFVKWLKNTKPNWQLTPDDYEAVISAIFCQQSAKGVETRQKNKKQKRLLEEKAKQPEFDF